MADLIPSVRLPFAISICEQGSIVLPSSYTPASGIVISLVPGFSSVKAFWLEVDTLGSTFNVLDYTVKLDTPTPGKVTLHLLKTASLGGPLIEDTNLNFSTTTLHYTALGVA